MSKTRLKKFKLAEVSALTGLDRSTVVVFIQREWVCPATTEELDEEDVARIRLIQELRTDFGANDESIPIILHLMDQLYVLRQKMQGF